MEDHAGPGTDRPPVAGTIDRAAAELPLSEEPAGFVAALEAGAEAAGGDA